MHDAQRDRRGVPQRTVYGACLLGALSECSRLSEGGEIGKDARHDVVLGGRLGKD